MEPMEDIKEKVSKQEQSHLIQLADLRFEYGLAKKSEIVKVKKKILAIIKENKMAPYYSYLTSVLGWKSIDQQLLKELTDSNENELKEIEGKIKDAEANLGETEIRDAYLAQTNFYARIGKPKDIVLPAFDECIKKTAEVGIRIDIVFAQLRYAFFLQDTELIKILLDKVQEFVDKGGDWERRNRLKIYRALFFVQSRDLKGAASLFLDSIATFTCTELIDEHTLVFLTVLCAILSLDRVNLRKKVVECPEILAVIPDIPNIKEFLMSLFKCEYKVFFQNISPILKQIEENSLSDNKNIILENTIYRYIAPHTQHYLREIRLVAYKQFLTSYKSITISSIASTFGVTRDFIDRDLSHYISSQQLHCKIDKVGGIIEINRLDTRNAQYQTVIQQGDLLLNKIQKLSRVIAF